VAGEDGQLRQWGGVRQLLGPLEGHGVADELGNRAVPGTCRLAKRFIIFW
jgi:hypothetical protein